MNIVQCTSRRKLHKKKENVLNLMRSRLPIVRRRRIAISYNFGRRNGKPNKPNRLFAFIDAVATVVLSYLDVKFIDAEKRPIVQTAK